MRSEKNYERDDFASSFKKFETPEKSQDLTLPIRRATSFNSNGILISSSSSPSAAANKAGKLSVNQISHYVTIIILGFYFILSTIPYAIVLSFYNNLTTKLEYNLPNKTSYLSDSLWVKYGIYRDIVIVFRLLFSSNHSLNFFFYLMFNRLFRRQFYEIFFQRFVHFFEKHF